MLTNYALTSTRANIITLTHGLSYAKTDQLDLFKVGRSPIELLKLFPVIFANMSRELYKTEVVADLYKRRDEFDVVLIDFFFNEIAYPFAAGKPFISVSVSGNDPIHSLSYGNFPNPAYVSGTIHHYAGPLSLKDRLENFLVCLGTPLLRYWGTFVPVQRYISEQFPDLPSLTEIDRNQSVAFMNSHFSMNSPPVPLLPGQVEIGGIHCREGNPLPKDILDFVSSDVPAILMSMGTAVSGRFMSQTHRNMFLAAFSKLPYRIIWKFDVDLGNVSSNVMIRNWLPQQDLLAHPNVMLFITHGGAFGVQEALYHATPILALPVHADQPKNAARLQNVGIGLTLTWDEVSEEKIVAYVKKLITETRYQTKISEMSALFRDQPETALERVVYWTEYVVRYRGATHLRSAEKDLSLIQLLHFDIFVILLFSLYLWYKISVFCVLPLLNKLAKSRIYKLLPRKKSSKKRTKQS